MNYLKDVRKYLQKMMKFEISKKDDEIKKLKAILNQHDIDY